MKDKTRDYDYQKLIEEEKRHYSSIEVTERLTEGGLHDQDAWHHYWSRVATRVGVAQSNLIEELKRKERPNILSLGSGYCGQELALAEQLNGCCRVVCTDINPELFEEARKRVEVKGFEFEFEETDLNFIEIEAGRYDLIFAHATLHHVVNLEQLFEQVASGLTPDGSYHIVEVIGQNRRLIWKENEIFANRLLEMLPEEIVGGARLKVGEDAEGMEGVRQEEILPLLRGGFSQVFEHLHGAFMRFLCIHATLGQKLDPRNEKARQILDFLIDVDDSAVLRSVLRPLELWGIYRAV